jgi:hypothetical protein
MPIQKYPYAEIARSSTCIEKEKASTGWKARRLLLDLANLPKPAASCGRISVEIDRLQRLITHYPEVFNFIAHDEAGLKDLVELLARYLRLAWRAPNARERNWHLFTVRQEYERGMLGTFAVLTRDGRGGMDVARRLIPGVPPKTPFDLTIHNAQVHLSKKMAVCARGNECDTPYFFNRRKGQRYCGRDCRLIALKKRNDAWWAKHGKRWRAERRKRAGKPLR